MRLSEERSEELSENLVEDNYTEVECEDNSFDYEYGSISSVHTDKRYIGKGELTVSFNIEVTEEEIKEYYEEIKDDIELVLNFGEKGVEIVDVKFLKKCMVIEYTFEPDLSY